jgi:hypothetical protein
VSPPLSIVKAQKNGTKKVAATAAAATHGAIQKDGAPGRKETKKGKK